MILRPPLVFEVFEVSRDRWGARGELSTDHGPVTLRIEAPAALVNDWQARWPGGHVGGLPVVGSPVWAAREVLGAAQDQTRRQLPQLAAAAGRPWELIDAGYDLVAAAQRGEGASIGSLAALAAAAALHPQLLLAWEAAQLAQLALPAPATVGGMASVVGARFGGLSLSNVLRNGTPEEAALAAAVASPDVWVALTGSSPVESLRQYRPDLLAVWEGC